MNLKAIIATAVVTVAAGFAATGASAAGQSDTTLVLKHNGGDFYGKVKSPDSANCLEDRQVKVYKIVGGQPEYVAMDTTDSQGKWNTGNNGAGPGDYFAKVKSTTYCQGDKSSVVEVN
jgi:hypothetical protein